MKQNFNSSLEEYEYNLKALLPELKEKAWNIPTRALSPKPLK
jgi:hypothetical protein